MKLKVLKKFIITKWRIYPRRCNIRDSFFFTLLHLWVTNYRCSESTFAPFLFYVNVRARLHPSWASTHFYTAILYLSFSLPPLFLPLILSGSIFRLLMCVYVIKLSNAFSRLLIFAFVQNYRTLALYSPLAAQPHRESRQAFTSDAGITLTMAFIIMYAHIKTSIYFHVC